MTAAARNWLKEMVRRPIAAAMTAGRRIDPWLFLLLVLGGLLLLAHLGNGRLWQDEAETAVLGRNILSFGYPKAFDGINHLNPRLPVQKGYAWTYHSWLPMYLAAGSFALFGVNTFAARLPFALLGIGVIALGYALAYRMTRDRWVARLTAFSLVTSVPFLLLMRQCRYYAPAVFFTLWMVLAYVRFRDRRPTAAMELALASILLFHADHGVFAPMVAALALHGIFIPPDPKPRGSVVGVVAVVALFTVPWMIYLQGWQHHRTWDWTQLRHHLEFYTKQINKYLFPIWFWLLAALFWRSFRSSLVGQKNSPMRHSWKLLGVILGVGILFLIFVPEQRHFRYLIFLAPFLFILQAILLRQALTISRSLGILFTASLLLTDLFHYSGVSVLKAQPPRVFLFEFFQELTHPYRGPIDGIVEYLAEHGKPGEVVKTPYEEHPLIFYTALTVEPSRPYEGFNDPSFPEWIVLRRHWLPSGFFEGPYFKEIQQRYQEIVLEAPDIPWQNRPDPGYHRFLTDRTAPPVVIYRRQR